MVYEMRLHDKPFNLIKNGTKTIELRLNDEKRKLLKVNDIIEFENRSTLERIKVIVIKLHKFDSFKDLYNHFDKEKLGYLEDEEATYQDMEEYYSIDEQNKYGVLGIEVRLI